MPVLFEKSFVLVQSAATTYTEVKVELPKADNELAWVYGAQIEFADPGDLFDAAPVIGDNVDIQVSKEPKTASAHINDKAVIMKSLKEVTATYAAGVAIIDGVMDIKPALGVPKPLKQSDIYVGIQSTNDSALTIYGKILYTRSVPKADTLEKVLASG